MEGRAPWMQAATFGTQAREWEVRVGPTSGNIATRVIGGRSAASRDDVSRYAFLHDTGTRGHVATCSEKVIVGPCRNWLTCCRPTRLSDLTDLVGSDPSFCSSCAQWLFDGRLLFHGLQCHVDGSFQERNTPLSFFNTSTEREETPILSLSSPFSPPLRPPQSASQHKATRLRALMPPHFIFPASAPAPPPPTSPSATTMLQTTARPALARLALPTQTYETTASPARLAAAIARLVPRDLAPYPVSAAPYVTITLHASPPAPRSPAKPPALPSKRTALPPALLLALLTFPAFFLAARLLLPAALP